MEKKKGIERERDREWERPINLVGKRDTVLEIKDSFRVKKIVI